MTSNSTNIKTENNEWVQWIEDGSGAFGNVYKAEWNSNNVVALKSFRNNNFIMKEIVNEFQLLHQVNFHKNIIKLIGITKRKNSEDNIIDPVYLLILEHANSGTLRNYLKENFSKLDWNIRLKFGIQIADAVSCLHQNEIVHRDLHSNNILVHQNIIKLADFGLSCRLAEASNPVKALFGMVPYIDPQHFKKQVDKNYYKPNKKSDVYSVGVLLWEISSGRKPFESYFEYQQPMLMLEILEGKRELPISDTPNDYVNVYEKCWKNYPDDRPDMQQVFSELELINLEKKNNIKILPISSGGNTVNTASNDPNPPYVDSLEGCKITNNDEIVNELLPLIYQKDYDTQLIKQKILLKEKSENEIFNYLLNNNDKDNQQNIILLAEFYKYGIGTDKNVVKAFELICKETGYVECKNETIDNFIQKMQLKTDDKLFEWIPYNQFNDIKEIGEAYLAVWKNGPLHYDNKMKEVTLKNITNEFLHKCGNNLKIYGISQNPDTKDYVMVLDDYCERCGEQYTSTNKWCKLCQMGYLKNDFTNKTSGNEKIDDLIQEMQLKIDNYDDIVFEWIPYNQFNNIKKIKDCILFTEYSAIWKYGPLYYDKNKRELERKSDKKVILKCLYDSQNITNRFLYRIKAYSINKCSNIHKIYGISQDPNTNNYILILEYTKGGCLNGWIGTNNSWLKKLSALIDIIIGLKEIHEKQMIHCSLFIGNILLEDVNGLYISDMELCRKVDDIDSDNNNYGVMPYAAPEILREKGSYTQAIDIYSFGLIMYFIATGKKPFANYDGNSILQIRICNGTRPEIYELEAPKCYIDLMKRCWDSNPDNRPNVTEVKKLIELFYESYCDRKGIKEIERQFDEAEEYRRKDHSSIHNNRSTILSNAPEDHNQDLLY